MLMSRARFAPIALLCVVAGCASPTPLAGSSDKEKETPAGQDQKSGEGPKEGSTTSNEKTTPPGAKPRNTGVVFLHGTGDQGDIATFTCDGSGETWRCESKAAVDEYWERPTIDSERKREDGSLRPYAVLGCPLGTQTPWPNPTPVKPKGGPAEPGSAACAAVETVKFLNGPDGAAGTDDDITDIVWVTHSGGSNVVRYMLQQHSAKPELERVHGASRGFIGIAAPSNGTYLADRIFRFGLLSLGNGLLGLGYDDDGVDFIQTSKMAAFNRDPAKLVNLSKDVAGVPSFMASGSNPDADGTDAQIECGGGTETKGLRTLHNLFLDSTDEDTFRDGCSDGFISCQSAMALANGDASRVVFGQLGGQTIGKTRYRAHNQSRRMCEGTDVDIRGAVNAVLKDAAGKVSFHSATRVASRARFEEANRMLDTHAGSIALEALPNVRRGAVARVRVVGQAAIAFFEDPTYTQRIPAKLERDPSGTLFATAMLPADATPGSWTAHVAESAADLEAHREALLPLWLTTAEGTIADVRIERSATSITLRVRATTSGAARLGIRAELVAEDGSDVWSLQSTQASTDAHGNTTELTATFPLAEELPVGKLVVRDIALVSHDDASTLDLRSSVAVP